MAQHPTELELFDAFLLDALVKDRAISEFDEVEQCYWVSEKMPAEWTALMHERNRRAKERELHQSAEDKAATLVLIQQARDAGAIPPRGLFGKAIYHLKRQ